MTGRGWADGEREVTRSHTQVAGRVVQDKDLGRLGISRLYAKP
jgi:hypothetical protein